MSYAHDTALICLLGWLAHWLASWGEAYKVRKCSLIDFIDDNPPAFWFSVIVTPAVYLIGPSILPALGVQMPAALDATGLRLIVAFLAGYVADSVVYKIANLIRKP